MKPLQVLSARATPSVTAKSSTKEAMRECMAMKCSFLREVVAMSLHRARRRIDDEAGSGCRSLTRVGIRIPLRERQVHVVPAAVERIRVLLTRIHVGVRRVRIATDGVALGEVGEHCATRGSIECGSHELTAALEPLEALIGTAQSLQSRMGVVDVDVVDHLAADRDPAIEEAPSEIGAILP